MEKKINQMMMDPEKAREILEFQSDGLNRGIFCMVFSDREHYCEARSNMELGAMIKAEFFYFVPDRHYIH